MGAGERGEEEDEVGDASTLFVPTTGGVDAATAQAFIAAQVTELVQRSQKVHKALLLSWLREWGEAFM